MTRPWARGYIKALPPHHLFADLEAASLRDNWDKEAFVLAFKCGPYGGYRLNEYRHAVPDGDGNPFYVNLAHDDPDANSIATSIAGEFLFHPGLYSTKKMTETISTITVDGKGQVMEGVSAVKDGRIVELFLQEGGISDIPDAIGELVALRKIHLYGDRSLKLLLLKKLSPTSGKCTEIEELLLNQIAPTPLRPQLRE